MEISDEQENENVINSPFLSFYVFTYTVLYAVSIQLSIPFGMNPHTHTRTDDAHGKKWFMACKPRREIFTKLQYIIGPSILCLRSSHNFSQMSWKYRKQLAVFSYPFWSFCYYFCMKKVSAFIIHSLFSVSLFTTLQRNIVNVRDVFKNSLRPS